MRAACALLVVAACGGNPGELWLAGDPSNELVVYLQDSEPRPY